MYHNNFVYLHQTKQKQVMNIFKEIEIPVDEEYPFKNCELGREEYGKKLEDIMECASNGCVMALNGAWGTGKTTFVRMWKQYLEKDGFKTLYLNAWETDFASEPLVGLMGQLQELGKLSAKKKLWKTLLRKAGEVMKASAFSFTKHYLSKIGLEGGLHIATNVIVETQNSFYKEIGQYKDDCNAMNNFRTALELWVDSLNNNKPLVFIVDELDRCNPHYAVKVLERIKHLFSVSKIVFVLSIDKEQLCNSIRGYYGSDKINAEEYLRRFIDIEFNLPEPDFDKFFNVLYEKLEFKTFFEKHPEPSDNSVTDDFMDITKRLFNSEKPSLRQMIKLLNYIRLVLQTYSEKDRVHPFVFVILIYLRHFHNDVYKGIKEVKYDMQGFVDVLEETLSPSFWGSSEADKRTIAYIIIECIILTREENNYDAKQELANLTPPLKSKHISQELLKRALDHYVKLRYVNCGKIKSITAHIEMLYDMSPL